jgi:exonuclease-1
MSPQRGSTGRVETSTLIMTGFMSRHLDFCINRVQLLLRHGVEPLLVFDGGKLPEKAITNDARKRYCARVAVLPRPSMVECARVLLSTCSSREEHLAKGLAFWKEGNSQAAEKCFQKACCVTPDMAYQLIERLKKLDVKFIVAPYEADAQLAYLSRQGLVAAVISEDSDLLVFGCHRVLYKLDNAGNGKQIRLRMLACNEKPRFDNWDQSMLQRMCILAGCDYLPSLAGMGLKKAHAYVASEKSLENIIRALRRDGTTWVGLCAAHVLSGLVSVCLRVRVCV